MQGIYQRVEHFLTSQEELYYVELRNLYPEHDVRDLCTVQMVKCFTSLK